jgi:hypothetical protein
VKVGASSQPMAFCSLRSCSALTYLQYSSMTLP